MQKTSLDESTGPRRGSVRSTGTKPAAIRAHGLGRRFNGVMAVDDLDLEIASGEIYGFLPRECPGRPGGAGEDRRLGGRRGGWHPLAPWPACWAPAAATAAGWSSAACITTVAGLDFPRATQAIRGTRRVRQGGRRTWRAVTVDPGHQPAHHQAGAAPAAGWLGGHPGGSRPSCPRPRRSRRLTVAAVSHVRAGR
jgi:hypothetical protein